MGITLLRLRCFWCSLLIALLSGCVTQAHLPHEEQSQQTYTEVDRARYQDRLEGFWLAQCIANWTGLVTEMDKIGGPGPHGEFYTRADWGTPDQPSIWGQGIPSDLSATIDWVFEDEGGTWGADDDTDIEYLYQFLLEQHQTTILTPGQIRDGWLKHIYSDANTPFKTEQGEVENYLWVSNQQALDLMREGVLPPDTSDPARNPHTDMIDAQLTTEIFGLFAPTRPDYALKMAQLPIHTTARDNAAWAAQFYVVMHSLVSAVDTTWSPQDQTQWMAQKARSVLPAESYVADMYDFVWQSYQRQQPWEEVRDALYQRYQVEQAAGYDITSRELYCNGCFAAGINFGASLISLFYGEGDLQETIKLAVLMGWDSDNPAATWGGMLGAMLGRSGVEASFNRRFASQFNIHRTRGNFPNNGLDDFPSMAARGVQIVDRVVAALGGKIDRERNVWLIPTATKTWQSQADQATAD